MFSKLHELADKIGIKPAVVDIVLTAVVLAVANWIDTGDPFDVDSVKSAIALALLVGAGIVAPPAQGVSQDAVLAQKPQLQQVTEQQRR